MPVEDVAAGEELSIHALRMESDSEPVNSLYPMLSFYPRSPHGERPLNPAVYPQRSIFLSTLSAWRATVQSESMCGNLCLSIHALRMESD